MAGETYTNATGLKQSLLDAMKLIVKDKAPLIMKLGTGMKPKQKAHLFDVDSVAQPASNNAAVEGADADNSTPDDFTQNTNYTQIIRVDYKISGTMEASEYAGVKSQVQYQKKKALKKIGLDLEFAIINATGEVGDATTAREMYGFAHWATANTAGTSTCASTAFGGTAGQDKVDDVLETLLEDGATPDCILLSAANKREVVKWTNQGATRNLLSKDTTLTNTIDVYNSTVGKVEVMLHTMVGDTNVYVMDSREFKIAYMRKPKTEPLAKVGDSHRFMCLLEATLEVHNPEAIGVCVLT